MEKTITCGDEHMDVFKEVQDFVDANHYVDVADKVPIFLCSVGTHIFNGLNKCGVCPHIPDDKGSWAITHCILRHDNPPIYTPMSHVADTRLHIMMRGPKGSGKSILLQLFLAPKTGLLYHPHASDLGLGFRTDIGPNSITEAGMFGSVDEHGEIVGRPLAREMCGGFLGFEEMSSLMDAAKKDHSTDIKNQLLTSTDSGRVKKVMRDGWVEYLTRYTIWGGTQPGRMDLESGLDRRFFIIDIDMNPAKERAYKMAQTKQSSMTTTDRLPLVDKIRNIQEWIVKRTMDVISSPPSDIAFGDEFNQWLMQDSVRGHEADLFRRLALGYTIMRKDYVGGKTLMVEIDEYLLNLLNESLIMRRTVMDEDISLVKTAFWDTEMSRSKLFLHISKMITAGDYQAAKRWVEENLIGRSWYSEYKKKSSAGRRGVMTYIGYNNKKEKVKWNG
jgi:hypothetical protein